MRWGVGPCRRRAKGFGPRRRGMETSLSVFLVFVSAFSAVIRVTVWVVVEVHFVHGFDSLGQIVLQGRDGRAQCRGPKAVRD